MIGPVFGDGEQIAAHVRRPCAAARLEPLQASSLKVPFARCGDGVARHVSAIAAYALGPFRCLGCEEALTLRRPRNKRRHFAHRPDSLCTGETALHRYAKEILAARKTLTLPAELLQEEGVIETVFAAGTYTFDVVNPEETVDSFRPDALVTYRGVQLAVEFLVSHAVSEAKRAKVRERDLSMVEIDLSGVRAGQMDGETLDDAILHSSPRRWIHHRHTAAAKTRLADAVKAKKVERGARLRGHILRKRRPRYPEGWRNEALVAVRRAGLEALVGIDTDCSHWFTVPNEAWQAEALYAHVISPAETYSPGSQLRIKGEFPNEDDLASKLPEWMIRTDLGDYPAERLEEAGFIRETYGSPSTAVWWYFAELSTEDRVIDWRRKPRRFYVDEELHGRLHRRVELPRLVSGLLETAGMTEPAADYERWATTYRTDAATPRHLIEKGGKSYRDLMQRLEQLRWMVPSYSRTVVDDLCGLPLEAIRRRNEEAIAKAEAEKAAALEKSALERQRSIRLQAEQMLEGEARVWLAQKLSGSQMSFLDYAREGDDALFRLERQLAKDSDARRKRIATELHIGQLRSQLTDAARRAFPTEERANLFLNTGHPRLRGQRPIDYCTDNQTLMLILPLLPKHK